MFPKDCKLHITVDGFNKWDSFQISQNDSKDDIFEILHQRYIEDWKFGRWNDPIKMLWEINVFSKFNIAKIISDFGNISITQ